jgi:hypothetical protein
MPESLANGPLHSTIVRTPFPGGVGFSGSSGAGVADAWIAGGFGAGFGAGLGALGGAPGSGTAPGIGWVICDGASWSSGLRLGWLCWAELGCTNATPMAKAVADIVSPPTSAAPIKRLRIPGLPCAWRRPYTTIPARCALGILSERPAPRSKIGLSPDGQP